MKKFLAMILAFCFVACLTACVNEENADTTFSAEENYQEEAPVVVEEEEAEEEEEISFEDLPDPVMIEADFQVTTNPDGTFIIETNLPNETELSLTLKGRGYLAQGKAFVENGIAVSEQFSRSGSPLVGNFTLEVLMPIPNVQSDYVRHFIGPNGEYLTGPYVKGSLGTVVVSKEFDVSFFENAGNASSTNNSLDVPR